MVRDLSELEAQVAVQATVARELAELARTRLKVIH
jgi:hypothetical protein